MSYDEFNGSSFDLNHDGHIDSAESSFIEDTYYEDHHGISSGFDEEDDADAYVGYRSSSSSAYEKRQKTIEEKQEEMNKALEDKAVGVVVIALIIMGVMIFVGNNLMGALVVLGIYGIVKLLGAMY